MIIHSVQSLPQPDGSTAYIINDICTTVPGDPMWQSVQEWFAAGNRATSYVPPGPMKIDPEIQLRIEMAEDDFQQKMKLQKWQARAKELKSGK